MRSQESFDLLQSAQEVRVAVKIDGDRIGGLLNDRYPPSETGGGSVTDYQKHMVHIVDDLDQAQERLILSEDEHASRQVVVSRLITERDAKVAANYEKLISVRQGLDSVFGEKGGFEMAHVSGKTPRSAEKLTGQIGQSVKLLREPAVEPRTHKVGGFKVKLSEVADDLEDGMKDLNATSGELREARKRAEGSMLAKREAIGEFRRTLLWVARTAEGLFHRAGEHELADRIRSSSGRPLRPSEQQPPVTEEATAQESSAQQQVREETAASQPAS